MTSVAIHHRKQAARASHQSHTITQLLLGAGIAASLLYLAMTVIAASQWDGYDWTSQTISELSAIGAPTRTLWGVMAAGYTLLTIAFACGVLRESGKDERLNRAGVALLSFAVLGFVWPFSSMHLRETLAAGGGTFTDTMHIALSMASVALMFAAIAFASGSFSTRFRVYSLVTTIVLLVFGGWTALMAPAMQADLPTPWMGSLERISLGAFLAWMVVFAVLMIRKVNARYA